MAEELKRTYIIPLRRSYANTPKYKRANKAVRVLKKYLVKHMKSEKIKIGPKLNDLLWENGIKNPPGKVSVLASKDAEGVVRAELTGFDYVDFKQQEKVEAPKNLQDKLKKTVEDAKGTPKEAPKVEAKEEKVTPVKTEAKSNKVTNASNDAPKAEVKAEPVKADKKAE